MDDRSLGLAHAAMSNDLQIAGDGELVAEFIGKEVVIYEVIGEDGPMDGSETSIYLDRVCTYEASYVKSQSQKRHATPLAGD